MKEKRTGTSATTATTSNLSNASNFVIRTVNPTTGRVIGEYDIMTKEQIKDKVKNAKEAFLHWKKNVNK